MPRPRKPSNILELNGAFKANPQRRRKVIHPAPTDLGAPPAWMTREQAAVWHEIMEIAPPNIIKSTDAIAVSVFACLVCEFRADPVLFSSARVAQLMGFFSRFGMTPADREKISIDQGEITPPKFAEFG